MSPGIKRRICWAMALIGNPKVLFLDEPTCAVDHIGRRSLLLFLKKMKKSAVMLTTHNMEEAEYFCQSIAILIKG